MSQTTKNFLDNLSKSRIVVILRNINVDQCIKYVDLLNQNKFDTIEVTLNSPDPFTCIKLISKNFPNINLGAGTVIDKEDVNRLEDMGIKFIVSPNTNGEIIEHTLKKNLVSIPGFYSATEGLKAVEYGATILKLFPSGDNGFQMIKDYSAVFPKNDEFIPTGGVSIKNIKKLLSVSFAVGIGSALFSTNISFNDFSYRMKNIKALISK